MWCHSKNLCCYGNEFATTNSALQLHCRDQVWKEDWLRTSKLLISPIIIKCGETNYEEQMKGEYFNYFQSAMFQSFSCVLKSIICSLTKQNSNIDTKYKLHKSPSLKRSYRWQLRITKVIKDHPPLYHLLFAFCGIFLIGETGRKDRTPLKLNIWGTLIYHRKKIML